MPEWLHSLGMAGDLRLAGHRTWPLPLSRHCVLKCWQLSFPGHLGCRVGLCGDTSVRLDSLINRASLKTTGLGLFWSGNFESRLYHSLGQCCERTGGQPAGLRPGKRLEARFQARGQVFKVPLAVTLSLSLFFFYLSDTSLG